MKSKFYKTKDDMKRLAELEKQRTNKQVEKGHTFVLLFILLALIVIIAFMIYRMYF